MNEDRRDDVVDDRPYSRRWLVRGAAAFAIAGGIGSLGMVRWASARDDDDYDDSDDDYEDRGSLDDDDKDDDHGDDDNSGHGGGDDHDDDDHDDDDHDDDDDSAGASSAADQPDNQVDIRDETFIPSTITVNAGEWVTWVNFDDDEHTATGEDFDTGDMETGARAEVQFNTPGTFTYVCQYHSDMVGEVIVLGAEGTPQASPEASPAASPVAGGGQEAVSIIDFAFEPQTLQVSVGTTVVWTNDGSAPHTVSGDPLDSGTLSAGDSFQFTFNSAGTFDYVCAFHPQMTGTIEVTG